MEDISKKSVVELRTIARENLGAGAWIASANKETLLAAIAAGYPPQREITVEPQHVEPQPAPAAAGQPAPGGDLAAIIAQAIAGHIKPEKQDIDQAAIEQAMKKLAGDIRGEMAENLAAMEKIMSPRRVELEIKSGDKIVNIGRAHYLTELLLHAVRAGIHCYLAGPAGSGKTTAAEKVAQALGLEFGCISVGPETSQVDLFGYRDANGRYVETEFRRRYEAGGVFLVDEIDAADPAVLTAINASIANGVAAFPDGMIKRSPDFILIAAGNTYGTGASRQYIGRNALDASTRDRFAFIDWPYDESLEAAILGVDVEPRQIDMAAGGSMPAEKWLQYVQRARAAAESCSIKAVISPRASIFGAKLLAAGIGRDHVENMILWKKLDQATIAKVKANM